MKKIIKDYHALQDVRSRCTAVALCMVCTMFFAAAGCGRQEASHVEDEVEYDFFYTDEGKKEIFTIRRDKVIIKTESEADAKALCEQAVFLSAYDVAYVWVLATIDPKKTTLDDLMKMQGVVDATYGLEYIGGALQYPKNQIFAKCKEGQSLENVLNETLLSKNVEEIELFNPHTELFLVTLNVKLGDIMQICRDLYESGLCKSADPSFIIEMKHPL